MAGNTLRVGVVGVGFGVAVHVPAFRAEGWEVTAICARTPEKVAATAKDHEVPYVFTDFHDLVASDQVDAVAIVTPPIAHAEATLAAIGAGKHVLCEKPFAMNISEAKAMRDAAIAEGVTAMIAHEFRYTPQRLHAKDLMTQGYVGQPGTVYAQANFALGRPGGPAPMTWQANLADGGGALGALGSHFLDSMRWWVGDITAVSAHLATLRPDRIDAATGATLKADGDDTFTINLRFANGAVGALAYTATAPVQLGAQITISGTEGVLSLPQAGVNPTTREVVWAGRGGDAQVEQLPMPEQFQALPDDRDRRIPAFRRLVRDFTQGIRDGNSPSPNFDDGVAVQAILDAARESSATGREVEIRA